jgi:hypothetical protein
VRGSEGVHVQGDMHTVPHNRDWDLTTTQQVLHSMHDIVSACQSGTCCH